MTGFWKARRRTIRRRVGVGQRWRQHWRAHLLTVLFLVLVWLALWGAVTVPLVLAGVVLAVLVLVAFPLPPLQFRFGFHPWHVVILVARFAVDVVAASVEVSYLALRRRPPATDVVVVHLVSDSDLIQHLTALAVSLIPGSLIIDADPTARTLTIHVLYVSPRSPDGFVAEVSAQERRFLAALGQGSTSTGASTVAPAGASTVREES